MDNPQQGNLILSHNPTKLVCIRGVHSQRTGYSSVAALQLDRRNLCKALVSERKETYGNPSASSANVSVGRGCPVSCVAWLVSRGCVYIGPGFVQSGLNSVP